MKNREVIRIQIVIKKQINFILLFKYFECVNSPREFEGEPDDRANKFDNRAGQRTSEGETKILGFQLRTGCFSSYRFH